MTRENKLALVVGFALILFVGILISDHFSAARNHSAANLLKISNDAPLAKRTTTGVIDLTPGRTPPTPAISPTAMPANDQPRPEQQNAIDPHGTIYMQPPQGGTQDQKVEGFNPVPNEPQPELVKVAFHDVATGETLFAICRDHYGDISLVKALAKYNKMDDPASVRVGRRLMMPAAEVLGGQPSPTVNGSTSTPPSATTVAATKPATSTYTVQRGDSLAQIAQRFLGSKSKWKKLQDMNRDVIDDPHDLKIGTVLKVL